MSMLTPCLVKRWYQMSVSNLDKSISREKEFVFSSISFLKYKNKIINTKAHFQMLPGLQ